MGCGCGKSFTPRINLAKPDIAIPKKIEEKKYNYTSSLQPRIYKAQSTKTKLAPNAREDLTNDII